MITPAIALLDESDSGTWKSASRELGAGCLMFVRATCDSYASRAKR